MESTMEGSRSQAGFQHSTDQSKEIVRMVKIVQILFIGIVLLVIVFRMRADSKKTIDYKQTYATIDRVIFSDTGNAKYYVSFQENGDKITAQTDHYSSETKSLNPGDEVKIGYYFTKNNTPWAVILDERVIPVSSSISGFCKFLAIVGILFVAIALAMFIRMVVL